MDPREEEKSDSSRSGTLSASPVLTVYDNSSFCCIEKPVVFLVTTGVVEGVSLAAPPTVKAGERQRH